nr:hypothetical protein [Endozoicomonas sp. OPT23]
MDVVPGRTRLDDVLDARLHPVSDGLLNWFNMCFMNSSLQQLAFSAGKSGALEDLERGVPLAAAKDIIQKQYPSCPTNADAPASCTTVDQKNEWVSQQARVRAASIERLAKLVVTDPARAIRDGLVDAKGSYHVGQQLNNYFKLRNSFLNLCYALNDRRPAGSKTLTDYQRSFLRDYLEFGRTVKRAASVAVLGAKEGQPLLPATIQQQDPEEFTRDIMDVFGLTERPDNCLLTVDHKEMLVNGIARDSSDAAAPDPVAILPIPLEGNHNTIQGFVQQFTEPGILGEDNKFNWGERAKGLGAQGQITTRKQLLLRPLGERAPETLRIQLKLFDNQAQKPQIDIPDPQKPGSMKKSDSGNEILKNLGKGDGLIVKVPILPAEGNRATLNTAEPIMQDYVIDSIVCHKGATSTSGHYITIRFENNSITVCDDDVVLGWQEYASFKGLPGYTSWEDFCEREGLSGYVFSMQKMEQPIVEPYQEDQQQEYMSISQASLQAASLQPLSMAQPVPVQSGRTEPCLNLEEMLNHIKSGVETTVFLDLDETLITLGSQFKRVQINPETKSLLQRMRDKAKPAKAEVVLLSKNGSRRLDEKLEESGLGRDLFDQVIITGQEIREENLTAEVYQKELKAATQEEMKSPGDKGLAVRQYLEKNPQVQHIIFADDTVSHLKLVEDVCTQKGKAYTTVPFTGARLIERQASYETYRQQGFSRMTLARFCELSDDCEKYGWSLLDLERVMRREFLGKTDEAIPETYTPPRRR